MRRPKAIEIKELNILQYYRPTRRWAARTYGVSEPNLEFLIYLNALGRFTRKQFMDGEFTIAWDKARWDKLRRDGWIDVFRRGNRKNGEADLFKTSAKTNILIHKIYRILMGEENIPDSNHSIFNSKSRSYSDKRIGYAVRAMNNDKKRGTT